jgi:uncharacterized membrane protein
VGNSSRVCEVFNMDMKKLFSFLIGAGIALPSVLAASTGTDSALVSLQSLFRGIAQLFKGNMDGFVMGLKGGIPVIGVFLIVWQFFSYLGKITIFKGEEGRKHANYLGIGLGLIAVAYPSTYSLISMFFGITGITIFFILALIFMFYQFIVKKRTDITKDEAKRLRAKKDEVHAKRDANKELHDEKLEKTFDKKELNDLKDADDLLRKDISEERNVRELLDQIRQLLSKLGSPNMSSQTAMQIKQQLMSKVAPFTGLLKKEEDNLVHLKNKIHQLEQLDFKDLSLDKNEDSILSDMKSQYISQLKDDDSLLGKNEKAEDRVNKYGTKLAKLIHSAKSVDSERLKLLKFIDELDAKELSDANNAERLAKELSSALSLGDFGRANSVLVSISSYLDRLDPIQMKVREVLLKIESISKDKLQIDNELRLIEKEILHNEKSISHKLRSLANKYN